MARKKKEKVENKVEEVVQVVENTASSRGNVNINVYRKDKLVRSINTHNSGTIYLCEYLRDALIGENVIARRPGKIKICHYTEAQIFEPYYSYPIKYSEGWKNNFEPLQDTSCSASVSFFIPSSILTNGMKIDGFQLFSLDTNEKYYAVVDLTKIEDPITHEIVDQSFTVSGDTNIEIEWTLKVSYV